MFRGSRAWKRALDRAKAVGLLCIAGGLAGCGQNAAALDLRGQNLLITLTDATSAVHVSPYGYPRSTTPFLSRMAETGLRFRDVTAAAPYTLASVASLFTGEHVDVHKVEWAGDPLPPEQQLLAEAFQAAGYRTFGYSSNLHISPRFGFDRGFERFEFIDPNGEPGVDPDRIHHVPASLLSGLEQELSRDPERPWFGYVHLMPPHAPYLPPEPFRSKFGEPGLDPRFGTLEFLTPISRAGQELPAAERQAIIDLYDAGLAYADSVLEHIAALLEASGEADSTLWVSLSDHGEAFGESGLYQHSSKVLESMLRVPLLMRFPTGALAGQEIADPISLIDLNPTLRDLFHLPGELPETSISLLPLLAGQALAERPAILARTAGPGPYTSIRRGRWKLVYEAQTKKQRLYDVEADFFEQHNRLSAEPEAAAQLQRDLALWLGQHRPRAMHRSRLPLDDATRAQLRAIGYLQDDTAAKQPEGGDPQDD